MKTRIGFVSNSSSASFVIAKGLLTPEQFKGLLDYVFDPTNTDGWFIIGAGEYIDGYTTMDNDAIDDLFEKLQIPEKNIRFHGD